jgi:hypothetical protein
MAKNATAKTEPAPQSAYDVAISFLIQDERTARALNDELEASGLNVFFFPRKQEELAGTNGMESMRKPFLAARVNVVLFRKPWSETPWTRVEDAAISERCFNGGWSSLMFVQLDKISALPKWLPGTHIRFSFEDYGINQLVGAIKLRVQEEGGVINPIDALGKAQAVKREADYLADRDRLMRDGHWIGELDQTIQATMAEVGRLVSDVNTKHGLNIEFGIRGRVTVLRAGYVSIGIGWQQPIVNYVGDDGPNECHLWVAEFSGLLNLANENRWYIEQPRKLMTHKFKVDVGQDRRPVWRLAGKKEDVTESQLADHIVRVLLDLVSRANQGKVERPRL